MASKEQEIAIKIAAQLEKSFGKNISEATNKISKLGSIAKKAATIAGGAFAAMKVKDVVVDAANTYKTFEQAMSQTAATAGASDEEYKAMEAAALAAGKATTKTAEESAQALGYMSLAGWNTQQSIKGLMPILRASEATQMDLATTSDLVTDSLSALGLGVDDLSHYLDVAIQANNKSNQTAGQMMEAFISAGLTLNDLGDSIENVSGLYGMLANRGTKASEAGTAMKAITVNVKKNAEAIEDLGVKVYDAEGNFRGISKVLEDYNKATRSMNQEQRDAINLEIAGKNHLGSFNKIMEGFNTTLDDGTTEWESLQASLNGANGALDNMADKVTNTMSGALERLNSAIDDVKINFIKQFAPYATVAINKVAEVIPKITEKVSEGIAYAKSNIGSALKSGADDFRFIKITAVNAFENIKSKIEEGQPVFEKVVAVANDIKGKLGAAFKDNKPTISYVSETLLPSIVDGMIKVLDSATDVYTFISSNWSLIGPIAKGIGAAIVGIKMATFAKEVTLATKALTLLRIAKVKDKIETLILQGLYAKDAIVKGISTAATYAQIAATTAWNAICGVATAVTTALGAAFAFLTSPIGLVILAIAAVLAIVVLLIKNWDKVKNAAGVCWDWIKSKWAEAGQWFASNVTGPIGEKFVAAKEKIVGAFRSASDGIKSVFNGISGWFSSHVIDPIVNKFNKIKNMFSGFSIGSSSKSTATVTSTSASYKVPKLATGGIATSATFAEIGEGKEPEAVMPLSKLANMINGYIADRNAGAGKKINIDGLVEDVNSSNNVQPVIHYSPSYNFYGEAPSKKDLEDAGRMTQNEFNKMLDNYFKNNKRTKFA